MSIVTPSYNQGEFIEQTIRSVLLQGFPNLEYVIVDGGSTDHSVEIIRKYVPWLSHWVSEPDGGQSAAINKGFRHATGDLLAWLNSDDYYTPGTFNKVAAAASAHAEAHVFVGAGQSINPEGKLVDQKTPPKAITLETLYNWLSYREDFMQPSCFFRKSAWEVGGPLDETLHLALDLDLWLRMAKASCRFLGVNELLSTAIVHAAAKTAAFAELSNVNAAIVIISHGGQHAARRHLEEMARELAWCKPNLMKILTHPIFRMLEPAIKLFVKPAVRYRDAFPPWTNTGK
jgi:glycosyltransferase involved in cell wall biosynthesis